MRVTGARPARLVLADGEVFEGEAIGAPAPVASGEVVFNTVMSGYQEVITDPSYAGQIIAFTVPHVGNCGANPTDDESARPRCRGVIVRDLARRPSNWRAAESLEEFLTRHGVAGLAGIDTRRLTRHIREAGAMPAAFGTADEADLAAAARSEPGTAGVDLVSEVTADRPYTVGSGPVRIVAYDLGIKTSMLRKLEERATVTVVPAHTGAADALALAPDAVLISNGPGDPEMAGGIVGEIDALLGAVPVFGICLGHQVMALALGGRTFKMKFGHHGGNVPVKDLRTGAVEITSQNHNFAVAPGSTPGITETHVCLNDSTLEGFTVDGADALAVQYHPEAGPGPHDSHYLFAELDALMGARR